MFDFNRTYRESTNSQLAFLKFTAYAVTEDAHRDDGPSTNLALGDIISNALPSSDTKKDKLTDLNNVRHLLSACVVNNFFSLSCCFFCSRLYKMEVAKAVSQPALLAQVLIILIIIRARRRERNFNTKIVYFKIVYPMLAEMVINL